MKTDLRGAILGRLKELRMSQRALHNRLGEQVSYTHLSNFLTGRKDVSLDTLEAVLDALGMQIISPRKPAPLPGKRLPVPPQMPV